MTLNVALSILKAGYRYQNYEALFDTLTQQILDSDSPLSLVLCAYLAYKIHVELSPKARTQKYYEKIEYLSSSLPYISILDLPIRSSGWKNDLNRLCSKLGNRLKQWKPKTSIKPLSGESMRLYANCIPALFDKDLDQHKAFIVFSHMVDEAHFIIFTLEALVQRTNDKYVMNLPLILDLINVEAYKATIKKLINDASFRTDVCAIIDIRSVAAYEVVLGGDASANSVSAEKVDRIAEEWEQQINAQSSSGSPVTVYM